MGSLVTVLLKIFSWFWQWNNFENRLMFGKVKAYKNGVPIFGPPCIFRSSCLIVVSKFIVSHTSRLFKLRGYFHIMLFWSDEWCANMRLFSRGAVRLNDFFDIHLTIVTVTGWVCSCCRSSSHSGHYTLNTALSKAAEEIANIEVLDIWKLMEPVFCAMPSSRATTVAPAAVTEGTTQLIPLRSRNCNSKYGKLFTTKIATKEMYL